MRHSLFSVPVETYQRGKWPVILLVDTDGSIHGYGDRFGGSFGLEDAQALVSAFGAPLLELVVEVRERVAHRFQDSWIRREVG